MLYSEITALCSEMHAFLSVRACGTYGYRKLQRYEDSNDSNWPGLFPVSLPAESATDRDAVMRLRDFVTVENKELGYVCSRGRVCVYTVSFKES